jgi:hypothetical protein
MSLPVTVARAHEPSGCSSHAVRWPIPSSLSAAGVDEVGVYVHAGHVPVSQPGGEQDGPDDDTDDVGDAGVLVPT